jgi:DNA helicase-2/ATP-dependent DNA helicase PcrA
VKQLSEGLFPARAGNALTGFLKLIERMQAELLSASLEAQVEGVLDNSGVRAHFMKMKGERAEAKRENLEELLHAAKQFEEEQAAETQLETLSDFLAHASLEGGEKQSDTNVPHVHLMTLHAAKGLEFPMVFLVGMEEGLFPGRQSAEDEGRLEEERRLCYVGMTRAMEKLVITHADIRRQHGREEYHKPSRFLKELPKNVLDEIRVGRNTHTAAYAKAPNTAPVYQEEVSGGFRLGQAVEHAKFGVGTVLALEGSGAHARLQVNFKTHGSKWLVAAYANLA